LLLDVVILTYECQQIVSEIQPPGVANRRCDCDGYRPDTLGGGIRRYAIDIETRVTAEKIQSYRQISAVSAWFLGSTGDRKRLSLIQMILLTHLKAGFEKGGQG